MQVLHITIDCSIGLAEAGIPASTRQNAARAARDDRARHGHANDAKEAVQPDDAAGYAVTTTGEKPRLKRNLSELCTSAPTRI